MTNPLTTSEGLPPDLADLVPADFGRGVSMRREDQQIPLVYVLQTGSPQCDSRGSEYVTGAEPGHFLLAGALNPVRDGDAGIEAIHCGMISAWTEWLPGRGGWVARHDEEPEDTETRIIKGDGGHERKVQMRSGSDNLIQPTRELYLLIDGAPFLLPCYSTRHTFARQWNTYLKQIKDPKTGANLPSFSRKYRLQTVSTANTFGKWFAVRFQDLGWVTKSEYELARAFALAVEQGAVRGAQPMSEVGEDAPRALPKSAA